MPGSIGATRRLATHQGGAGREQHAGPYLAEFEYRFNRRYDLQAMIPRLAAVTVTTAPCPTAR
jgi:hypothetical protein